MRRFVFPAVSAVPKQSVLAAAQRAGRAVADSLFTLFFPEVCRICDRPLESFTAAPVCPECLEAPKAYGGCECSGCGLFFRGAAALHGTGLCRLCRQGVFVFRQARSFAPYEGALRGLIHCLKYNGFRPLARPLAGYLAEVLERLEGGSWDLILPIPLHPRRQRERGFNQAELLAARLAKLAGLPLAATDCIRVRETRPQTGLRAAERRRNVAGAFDVPRPQRVKSRRLLLVDDVLTTGATADACAQALLAAGAEGVWVVTLARANLLDRDVL